MDPRPLSSSYTALRERTLTVIPLAMMVTVICGSGPASVNELVKHGGGLGAILGVLGAACFVAVPQALTVSELGSMMPTQAGALVWVTRGLGPRAGFVYGWIMTAVSLGDISSSAAVAAHLFVRMMGQADSDMAWYVDPCLRLCMTSLGLLVAMLSISKLGHLVLPCTVALMLCIAVGLVFAVPRLTWFKLKYYTAPLYGINYGTLAATALWQYTGVLGLGTTASDVVKPQYLLYGLLLGIALLMLNYVGLILVMVAFATFGFIDFRRESFMVVAFNSAFDGLGAVVGVAVGAAAFGALAGSFFVDGRAIWGVSRLGWGPHFLGRHLDDGTPFAAMLTLAVCALPFVFFDLSTILVVFYTLGAFAQTMPPLAQLKLRWARPDEERPVRVPGDILVNCLVTGLQVIALGFICVVNLFYNTQLAITCGGVVAIIVSLSAAPGLFDEFAPQGTPSELSETTSLMVERSRNATPTGKEDPPLLRQSPAGAARGIEATLAADGAIMQRLRVLGFLD